MELHTLKPAVGSVKKGKRIARGQGSGHGGTSTRGHKGAKSRSGYKSKRNFEGGQMPLQMRLPKRGFKSPNRVEYVPLNLDRLQAIAEKFNLSEISTETLVANGIARKNDRIKVLGGGKLKAKLSINVHAASASAVKAIEDAGGSVNLLKPAKKESKPVQKEVKVKSTPKTIVEDVTKTTTIVTETVTKTETVAGEDPEFDILMSDTVEESGTVVNVVTEESSTTSDEEE